MENLYGNIHESGLRRAFTILINLQSNIQIYIFCLLSLQSYLDQQQYQIKTVHGCKTSDVNRDIPKSSRASRSWLHSRADFYFRKPNLMHRRMDSVVQGV